MTKKEMFAYIAEAMANDEAVVAFCQKEIDSLATKAEKAKTRAAAKRAEGDALKNTIAGMLTNDFQIVADFTNAINDEEVTNNKVVYRLNALVAEGIAEKADVKVETEDGKTRVVKAFRLVQAE